MIRSSNANQSAVQYYRKFGLDIPLVYKGAATSDIQKNGLYVVCVVNDTSDVADFDGISRVTYVDD